MSESVTFSTIGDEAVEIFDEEYDYSYSEHDYNYSEHNDPFIIMHYFELYLTTMVLVIGVPCNILALLLLIRRRLWLQHEAYVYLAAILTMNTVTLVIYHTNRWLYLIDHRLLKLSTTADILCKVWEWVLFMTVYVNWLHVLMLLNVYLRQQLMTSSDRRGCYMNLAAKFCSLLGAKVILSSFFTFCALVNYFSFSITTLQDFSDTWHCSAPLTFWTQYDHLVQASWWLGIDVSLLLVIPLLLLVVWKVKRSSGFNFSHINGDSQDNGDVKAMVRIVLLSAAAFFVLNAPLCVVHAVYTFSSEYHRHFHIIFEAVRLTAFSYPLSAPIVCFSVKSRIRDDLKAIIVNRCCNRCCPGAICNRPLSPGDDSNDTVVLGMVPIEEDSNNI